MPANDSQAADERAGPLAGVRVIDLTQFILGPYATQTLGDMGADIIKVEEPSGDRQRSGGPPAKSKEMGPVFLAFNRNKRSMALDLKQAADQQILTRLIATGDIFIHNMRPSAIAKLGFSYEAVKAIKPDIIYVEAMGYDSEGPYAGLQAFDDLIQAASGAFGLEQMIYPEKPLHPLPGLIADKTCGLFAAIAMLAALRHKEKSGEGQYVAVPMLETFTSFLMSEHLYGETFVPPSGKFGYSQALTPLRQPLKTKDGYLMVFPARQEQAAKFMELGGIPGAYESERFTSKATAKEKVAEYYAMLAEAALTRSTAEWMEVAAAHSIPVMRANRPEGIFEDEQLKQTLFEERELKGEGTYRAMRQGLRFSKTPSKIRRDAPRIGEHNAEILAELDDGSIQTD